MRLKHNETSKGNCYYIIRSVYKNGKNTSEIYEKLGYPEEIIQEALANVAEGRKEGVAE